MERYFSKIVGTPVFEDGARPITTVKDLVIDPENGKVVALLVNQSKNLVISPMDIISWYENIKIHSHSDIIDADDVLRVQNIQKSGSHVYRNSVFTKDGKYLGKVIDYSIEPKSMMLNKIFVAKEFLGLLRFDSRVFGYNNILEILPDKIVVKNDLGVIKETKKEAIKIEDMAVT